VAIITKYTAFVKIPKLAVVKLLMMYLLFSLQAECFANRIPCKQDFCLLGF